MKFANIKTKNDFIAWISYQLNVNLANETSVLNKKRNILYTNINDMDLYPVLRLLNEYKIRHEKHTQNNYWIWVK